MCVCVYVSAYLHENLAVANLRDDADVDARRILQHHTISAAAAAVYGSHKTSFFFLFFFFLFFLTPKKIT